MRRLTCAVVSMAALLACAPSQTGESRTWYKGVTHIHSLWSDGDRAPEMIAAWYADRGYDFITFSEHNVLQQGDTWMPVVDTGRLTLADVRAIQDRFGQGWLETRLVEGATQMRLKTREQLQARFDRPGEFLIVPGEEITSMDGGPHVNALNLRDLIPGASAPDRTALIQQYVDAVRAQSARYDVPMMAHVNHVNFADGVTTEELIGVRGLEFFEVFNGHHDVYNWGNVDKGMPSTERHWDVMQSMTLLEDPSYTLYGIATDDSHHYADFRVGRANPGRGWVMVRADGLESDQLVDAMKRGDFYGSTGVTLNDVSRDALGLSLDIAGEHGIHYTTQFIGTRRGFDTSSEAVTDADGAPLPRASRQYGSDIGEVLAESTSLQPRYDFTGDEWYVRARVVSDKPKTNPFADGDMEMAWTQPVLVGR